MNARVEEQRQTGQDLWPELPYEEWKDTLTTLHMYAQIVGKVKLGLAPFLNHWWEIAFSVTARGFTSGNIPIAGRVFQVDFDFLEHRVEIKVTDGTSRSIPLVARSVADFYRQFMSLLAELQIPVRINVHPVEVEQGIPFDEDTRHASYDPEYVTRFWRILLQADGLLRRFRTTFVGKSSPPLFWWGSFDMSANRYSGRSAPERQYPARWMALADGHETSSAGFWPGSGRYLAPAFFSYTAPEPAGCRDAPIEPEPAFYHLDLSEFILPYEQVRLSPAPGKMVLDFYRSTYEAGATLAGWDRKALERPDPFPARD